MAKQANEFVTDDITDTTTLAWARMQKNWECCGGKNFEDYVNSRFTNDSGNVSYKSYI